VNIKIPENLNPDMIMRRSGYGLFRDRRYGTESYTKRLGNGVYPHFHVYIEDGMIKLHLDQKQASYGGSSAHGGEYDGEVVEKEIERIKGVITSLQNNEEDRGEPKEIEEKKGFFAGLFGK